MGITLKSVMILLVESFYSKHDADVLTESFT